MAALYYSALDLAAIIRSMDLGYRAQSELLDQVWENERAFIQKEYLDNKRQMIMDVFYWLTYLSDKPSIDAEFPVIQRDIAAGGGKLAAEAYTADGSCLDLFFKNARIRILYSGGKPYVRVKRRTLMKQYGYRRMSPNLVEYLHQCIYFYHLQPYVRDRIKCRIEDVGIDEMIVFRIM